MKHTTAILVLTTLLLGFTACEDEATAPNDSPQFQQATLHLNEATLRTWDSNGYTSSYPLPGIGVDTATFTATHNGVVDNPSYTFEFSLASDPTLASNPAPYEAEPIITSLSIVYDNMYCRDTLYWSENPPTGIVTDEDKMEKDAEITFRLKHGSNYSTLKYPDIMEDSFYKIESVWLSMRNDVHGANNQVTYSQTVSFDYIITLIDKRLAAGENRYYFNGSGSVTP